MKKTLAILLSLVMMITSLTITPVLAADEDASGTGEESLTWVLDSEGVLTISGTGDMPSWDFQSSPWCGNEDIKTIIIEDGLTSIGRHAFDQCTNLVEVSIPESVTSLGNSVFWGCSGLESITIPDSVTDLGEFTFSGCSSLSEVNLPGSITTIGSDMFASCTSLKTIVIPEGVTSIVEYAFTSCSGLESVSLPKSLVSIGGLAFGQGLMSFTDVYYAGTKAEYEEISVGPMNAFLTKATIHYNESLFKDAISIGTDENGKDVYSEGVNSTGHKAIYWAAENGITKGYADGTFKPIGNVTRQEMVTFLYRLAGKPSVKTSSALTFTDADEITSSGARKAIQWAVQAGITKGYSDGSFKPTQPCTRAEIAIFLYRLAKLQGREDTKKGSKTNFTDIESCGKAAKTAIAWATEEGIIKGYGGDRKGQFGPDDNCNRQQMAIMMMRYAGVSN